jgi:hypothetical protein
MIEPLQYHRESALSTIAWSAAALAMAFAACSSIASAGTNGTWTDASTGGMWSSSANWASGIIANGTDGIADFSTLDITADDTIHLNSSRTIGSLLFGDDTSPSNNWTLDNNGNASNILTLAVSSGAPQLQVTNQIAAMALYLAAIYNNPHDGSDADTQSH